MQFWKLSVGFDESTNLEPHTPQPNTSPINSHEVRNESNFRSSDPQMSSDSGRSEGSTRFISDLCGPHRTGSYKGPAEP